MVHPMNEEIKTCQNCKNQFTVEPDDFAFYEKIKVPPPTFCPQCRYQRRLTNRNEWNFYRRPCSLCGKSIVAIYNPEYPGPVYCQPCWWSDGWDPFVYGREFDFSRPFFEQFQELRLQVPHVAMTNTQSVNSEYTNQSLSNRNSHMLVSSEYCENCLYGYWNNKARECVDCYMVEQAELLYESLNCTNCSHSVYLEDCVDCTVSYFLKDCRGCASCFGSYGLRNKSYYWHNRQLTKEDYERRVREFVFSRANIEKERNALRGLEKGFPHKYYRGKNIVNSTGDYIQDIKNAHMVFNCRDVEYLRYCQDVWRSKDSIDCTEAYAELSYECEGVIVNGSIAITKGFPVFNSYYSELCFNSHDLFGCVGLNKTEYCILNRRYEKAEYLSLREKIIAHMKQTGEWGEFFPARLSLFAYNETVAQDYFPLTKEDAVSRGLQWHDRKEREYKITLKPHNIPETIREVDDGILQETIGCISQESGETKNKYPNCATAFRITPMELEFYRQINIPIPQKCSVCRRQDRLEMRNPRRMWKRACQCAGTHSENRIYQNAIRHFHGAQSCPNEFETSYMPERPEIVYCEQCYQAEIA
ncbi:MAG: Uncharacterized protein G01um101433_194 [Parcubacteria group bacterium Gr01-1014_33]|nr:MAG: Uncharacterized protein G01um101433_194 [Parcubacteria group bacterium Gr01-1014_33]